MKRKKKLNDLDKYLIFSFAVLIIFTIVCIVIYCFKGDEPSTLITAVFACFGGEVLCCATLKKLKLKKGDTENDS